MPLPFIIAGLGAIGSAIGAGAAAVGGAAAAGAAAVGSAAAAGAAAVGSVATAGAAAAGGAIAAGTAAIGSSAVGATAIGAMEAVGTGIGAAAATMSSAPIIGSAATTVATIATGTSTGAAAVGTIATTGVIGVTNGISGATKLSKADDIKNIAMDDYKSEVQEFERIQNNTNCALKSLGKDKLKIWESFERFSKMYTKIHNKPVMSGYVEEESLTLTPDELKNIQAVAISAKDILSGGVSSIASGKLIGFAATGGLINTVTVASTGTAISSLSGAAATNATLAAFGGGSLASGGAGMMGGTMVLNGLAIAPALMVGGIMLNGTASKALENANDIKYEVDKAIKKMKEAEPELIKVMDLGKKIQIELQKLNQFYVDLIDQMEITVAWKTNYREFTYEEKKTLEKTVLVLKLLKELSMQNILDPNQENVILEDEVNGTLQHVSKTRQKKFSIGEDHSLNIKDNLLDEEKFKETVRNEKDTISGNERLKVNNTRNISKQQRMLEHAKNFNNTFKKLQGIITEVINVTEDELTLDTRLRDFGIDSLDAFEIIGGIEEEFNIEIPMEEVERFFTIEDIVKYIEFVALW